jgi:tetratricopeptide (TPR) repeat protein
MAQGDFPSAITEFENTIAISPLYMRLDIWHMLGTCHEKIGRLEAAKQFYTKVILVDPRKETLNNFANLLWRSGNAGGAKFLLQKSLELSPDPISYNNLGAWHALRKEYPQAIESFKKAVDLKPDYFDAWMNLLNVYAEAGDKRTADQELNRMAKLFWKNHWPLPVQGRKSSYASSAS